MKVTLSSHNLTHRKLFPKAFVAQAGYIYPLDSLEPVRKN